MDRNKQFNMISVKGMDGKEEKEMKRGDLACYLEAFEEFQ